MSVPDNHIASEQEEAIEQLDPVAELRDDAVAASEAGAAAVEEDLGLVVGSPHPTERA